MYFVSYTSNGQSKIQVCDTTIAVRVVCRDADYNQEVENGNIMNLEVYRDNDKIQTITYKYENVGAFTLKHFDLLDLNFDGYTDILICAGHTANRNQPFYEGYLWCEATHKFLREPQINEKMPNLLVDTEKKQVYSYYIVNSDEISYSIYRYQQQYYILIGELKKMNALGKYPKYREIQYKNGIAKDMGYIKYDKLSNEWKNMFSFIANSPLNPL